MTPKVSVVMISKNDPENFLRESIDGFLKQTGVEVELILSTIVGDSSIEIARSMGVKHIIVNNKAGAYYQLEKGFELVTGDWCCGAGGNDVALPTKLIDEVSACLSNVKKICYSAFYETDENLNILTTIFLNDYDFDKHIKSNFVADNATISVPLLKKYLPFRNFGNYNYYDLWLRIAKGEGTDVFIYNNQPNFLYRRGHVASRLNSKRQSKHIWKMDEQDKKRMLAAHGIIYRTIKYRNRKKIR